MEDIPFRLLLVATWAVAWGAMTVSEAIGTLSRTGGGFARYLFAFNAGVLGAVLLVLAVLLFTTTPLVRKATILAFVLLAVGEAFGAHPGDPVGVATIGVHLMAAATLVVTRRFYSSERVEVPEDSAHRFGAR